MIGLIQRVSQAQVDVVGETIASIERGLLCLIGVRQSTTDQEVARLATRLLRYRVFPDARGRMNLSVQDIQGGVLLVPQFTLAADTRSGNRPSFSTAAAPQQAEAHFQALLDRMMRAENVTVASGQFAADMQVSLVNDGPVTFWLEP